MTKLITHYEKLNTEGFRVLAVAYKPLETQTLISKEDA
jgi:magnesium-transporting ATPase (P-type)